MVINFDDIKDVKKALKREQNKLLRTELKILQLEQVIKAHIDGIYNPKLYDDLMRKSEKV